MADPDLLRRTRCLHRTPERVQDERFTQQTDFFDPKDIVQAIPFKTWMVEAEKSISWDADDHKGACHVKVFKPQAIDLLLASSNNVPYGTPLKISKDENGYRLQR